MFSPMFFFLDFFSSIFLIACITVVWSLPPKKIPTLLRELSKIFLHKNIAVCLASTISYLLLLPTIPSSGIPETSETFLTTSSMERSLVGFLSVTHALVQMPPLSLVSLTGRYAPPSQKVSLMKFKNSNAKKI